MSAGHRAAPVDRLLAAYLVVGLVALTFPQRGPAALPVAAGHVLAIALLLRLRPLRPLLARASVASPGVARFIGAWHPLLLVPLLYLELPVLNTAVHGGHYFDATILGWEGLLFGGQPSRELAARWPALALSELLHGAYIAYYPIIYLPPAVLWLRGRVDAFRDTVFALMLVFVAHYLFFIFFPVQGPRYLFPAPGGAIADGWLYQFAHRILEAGSSQGAAFPSAHVGVAVAQCVMVRRFLPRAFPLLAALTLGLAVGAVYGGFHYAIDAVVGLLFGLLGALLAPRLRARLT